MWTFAPDDTVFVALEGAVQSASCPTVARQPVMTRNAPRRESSVGAHNYLGFEPERHATLRCLKALPDAVNSWPQLCRADGAILRTCN